MITPTAHRLRQSNFAIPALPDGFLRRERLLEFLRQNAQRKLILISAGAGYGKSSLLADYARETRLPVVWCRLDETDKDLALLIPDLIEALRRPFPDFQSVTASLTTQPEVLPEEIAVALVEEMKVKIDSDFILILDDSHILEGCDSPQRFLDKLLAMLPNQVQLILAGRGLPQLQLHRLMVRQQVAALGNADLRFNPDEIQSLFGLRPEHPLSPEEVEELAAETEGWIISILLSTHLLWRGPIAAQMLKREKQPLADYLAAEVLDLQLPEIKEFLLESAVLNEMEAPICDLILSRSNSGELLEQIVQRHLFIHESPGEAGPLYSYHPLFRDFLLAYQQAQSPARLQVLQRRAAEWYAANDLAERAVDLYVRVGELQAAARIAEANAEKLYVKGHSATLRRWLEQLQPHWESVPTLLLHVSKIEAAEHDLVRADLYAEQSWTGYDRQANLVGKLRAEIERSAILLLRGQFSTAMEIAQATAAKSDTPSASHLRAQAFYYVGLCHFHLHRLTEAEAAFREAIRLVQATETALYALAVYQDSLSVVLYQRGQTSPAIDLQRRALQVWNQLNLPSAISSTLNNIAFDLHHFGQLEAARDTYAQAIALSIQAGSHRRKALGLVGQGEVYLDLNQPDLALALYEQALAELELVEDPATEVSVYQAMAWWARRQRNYADAQDWLRQAQLIVQDHPVVSHEQPGLDALQGILLVETGHATEGWQVLSRLCVQQEQWGDLLDLAPRLFFRAQAEYQMGDEATASSSLTHALVIAKQVGHRQNLLQAAAAAQPMLQQLSLRSEAAVRQPALDLLHQLAEGNPPQKGAWAEGDRLSLVAAPAERPAFQIKALGEIVIRTSEGEIAPLTERQAAILLFLIDNLKPSVSRERVLETFWPDVKKPDGAFRSMIYRLRQILKHDLIAFDEELCWAAAAATLTYDVAAFERSAQAALKQPRTTHRLGNLSDAIALYTGDFMLQHFEPWVIHRRNSLSEKYVELLEAQAEELIVLTRHAEAQEILRRALVYAPEWEGLHQKMLTCLAGQGKSRELSEHYLRYVELRRELGMDPSQDTSALYARLIAK